MLTLTQAIGAISKATNLSPSSRQQFRIADGKISTNNGTVAAVAPFAADFPEAPLAVDAATLARVWTDTATAKIDGMTLVVRNRSSRYKLRIFDDILAMPDLVAGGEQITADTRDAILMAAKFVSKAATVPWLTAVSIRGGRAVATNRVAAVSMKVDLAADLTLPPWALQALRPEGTPTIRANELGVTLSYSDGLIVHSAPLSEPAPERLFSMVPEEDDGMETFQPFLDVVKDALALPGKSVRLDPAAGTITVVSEDNDEPAVTEIGMTLPGGPVTMQDPAFRLVAAHATHLSFARSPDRFLFKIAPDNGPVGYGIVAGMV